MLNPDFTNAFGFTDYSKNEHKLKVNKEEDICGLDDLEEREESDFSD